VRFKDFLREDEDSDYSEELKDLTAAVGNCKENLRAMIDGKQLVLWRGDEIADSSEVRVDGELLSFAVRQGRTHERESKSGNTAAMIFFSEKHKNLPDRRKSVFGTFDSDHADEMFDNLTLLIPYDSVRSFAYMEEDFNLFGKANEASKKRSKASAFAFNLVQFARRFNDYKPITLSAKDRTPIKTELPVYDFIEFLAKDYLNHFRLFQGSYLSDTLTAALQSSSNQAPAIEFIDALLSNAPTLNKLVTSFERKIKPVGQPDGNRPNGAAMRRLADHVTSFAEELRAEGSSSVKGHLEKLFSAEEIGVKKLSSLSEVKSYASKDEVWFEGPYLIIDAIYPKIVTTSKAKQLFMKLLKLIEESK